MSSNLNVPVIIWYFKESLRDFSHTKKRLWMKACGNWFMFANFSFKMVFWFFASVCVRGKKKVVMFLPVSLWHFVSPSHSERRGAFWIVWNCHYHCDSAEKQGENHKFVMKEIQAVHTHTRSETRGCCKQNYEVLWKVESCHPSLSTQHALGTARSCHKPWTLSLFGNRLWAKRDTKLGYDMGLYPTALLLCK